MTAFFKKELRSYFSSAIYWISTALTALLAGIFLFVYQLGSQSASFASPLRALSLALLIYVPLVVSRTPADEKRNGTDRFYATLPLSPFEITLAKFLAGTVAVLLPVAAVCLYPLILSKYGTVRLGTAYVAILGFALLAALMTSVSLLLAGLFRRKLFSIPVSVAGNLLLWSVGLLASVLPGKFNALAVVLNEWAVFPRFGTLLNGYFDLTSVLFFLSFIAFFLFFSAALRALRTGDKSDEGRRTKVEKTAVILSATLVCVILLNVLSAILPWSVTHLDVTGADSFKITEKTKKVLKELDRDVGILYLTEAGELAADADITAWLERYAEASDHVKLSVGTSLSDALYPFDSTVTGSFSAEEQCIVVSTEDYFRLISLSDLYYYYNSTMGVSLSPSEYYACLQAYSNQDYTNYSAMVEGYYLYTYASETVPYFGGEQLLTNAIRNVASTDAPKLGYLYTSSTVPPDSDVLDTLDEAGYDIELYSSFSAPDGDTDVFLLNTPMEDITAEDAALLSAYLNAGGKLLLTTVYQYVDMPNLFGVLEAYGLKMDDEVHRISEGNPNYYFTSYTTDSSSGTTTETPYTTYLFADVADHAVNKTALGIVCIPEAHPIELTETEGVTLTSWLHSSPSAHLMYLDETDPENPVFADDMETVGTYTYGAIAESDHGTVVWVSSPYFLYQTSTTEQLSSGGNSIAVQNVFDWLADYTSSPVQIDDKILPTEALSVSDKAFAVWAVVVLLGIPALLGVPGAVNCYFRKKR